MFFCAGDSNSWTFALAVLALVPADVAATMKNEPHPHLGMLWDLTYWTTFALTWFLLPIHQMYEDAADFSVIGRLKTSLRENLIFYGVILSVIVFGVVILVAYGTLTTAGLSGFGIVVSNMFGIVTGVFLLGYGLVEIPRSMWRSADVETRPRRAARRVGVAAEALKNAHHKLRKITRASETTQEVMPRLHPLRLAMKTIANETPKASVFASASDALASAGAYEDETAPEEEDDFLDYDYDEIKDLVRLRRALHRCLRVYRRTAAQYATCVMQALEAEAVATAAAIDGKSCLMGGGGGGGEARFRSPFRPPRNTKFGETAEKIEWWWKCRAQPLALRVASVLFGVFSALVVWSECTMWTTQAMNLSDVSPFSALVRTAASSGSDGGIHVAVMIPLGYMVYCAQYSLFRLGMFSFYQLVPRHTDSFSLLLNAALTCRYSAPLSLNFIMLVHSLQETGRETTFTSKMYENVPVAAQHFAAYFPMVLGVYCAAILFGFFDKLTASCCSCLPGFRGAKLGDKYTFESDDKDLEMDLHVSEGRRVVERERASFAAVEGHGVVGAGCPYYYDLRKRDIGTGSDDSGSGAADDIESNDRVGLLGNRTRSDESRDRRWERTKERLGDAVATSGRGGSRGGGRTGAPPSEDAPRSFASRFGLGGGKTEKKKPGGRGGGGSNLDSTFASLSRK